MNGSSSNKMKGTNLNVIVKADEIRQETFLHTNCMIYYYSGKWASKKQRQNLNLVLIDFEERDNSILAWYVKKNWGEGKMAIKFFKLKDGINQKSTSWGSKHI